MASSSSSPPTDCPDSPAAHPDFEVLHPPFLNANDFAMCSKRPPKLYDYVGAQQSNACLARRPFFTLHTDGMVGNRHAHWPEEEWKALERLLLKLEFVVQKFKDSWDVSVKAAAHIPEPSTQSSMQ